MAPNMSFAMTTEQMYQGIKDVTRRLGWASLKPGDLVMAVEKAQGLKRGEKIKRIGLIEVISNAPEHLDAIMLFDVQREGFRGKSKRWFIEMFCAHNKCDPTQIVNRIAFKPLYMQPSYQDALIYFKNNLQYVKDLRREDQHGSLCTTLNIPVAWIDPLIVSANP